MSYNLIKSITPRFFILSFRKLGVKDLERLLLLINLSNIINDSIISRNYILLVIGWSYACWANSI